MAETLSEKPICQKCNADVRPGALFCYHCGSSVSKTESSVNNGNAGSSPKVAPAQETKLETGKRFEFDEHPIQKPSEDPFALPVGKKNELNRVPRAADQNEAQSAAMRKRTRTAPAPNKNVEIIWEPAESSPNFLFILVAFFLLLVAIGILAAMLYIR